jgi:uncharacterized protein
MYDDPLLDRLDAVAASRCSGAGPAHDILHVRRVASAARAIAAEAGGDARVAVAAALLHELFNYPKHHPESHRSGDVCADQALAVLRDQGCALDFAEQVAYAIRVHPFSLGVTPTTLEAKILQDADRLDAIGAVGVARCFVTCGEMNALLYSEDDPFCRAREPDDRRFAVDHFRKKLLRVPDRLHTAAARRVGHERVAFLRAFLEQLAREIAS